MDRLLRECGSIYIELHDIDFVSTVYIGCVTKLIITNIQLFEAIDPQF